MKADTVRGHLEGFILAVLADGPQHGYGIIRELRSRSGGEFELPEGTVYPALQRLANAGLIDSSWTQVQGRDRRVYRVTASGREALERERAAWSRFAAAAAAVLGMRPGRLANG